MKQENSHRRRLWFLECLWSWKWLLRGFLWRRREATAHNHNANLSPLFFSSVLPLTWLPNAPKCSRTTWRFATTYLLARRKQRLLLVAQTNILISPVYGITCDSCRSQLLLLLSPLLCLRLFRSSVSFLLSLLRVEMLHAILGDGMSYYLASIGTGEKCTSIP